MLALSLATALRAGEGAAVCATLRELVLMQATLVASRDIAANEEVFYSYGSDKPFEHIRKKLQEQKEQLDALSSMRKNGLLTSLK